MLSGYADITFAGAGATSRVYRATETATGQTVALKRLHRQLVRSQDALARLKRELDALSRLRHPSIVAVRGVIRWQGDPTIVMDYVPGRDLGERLTQGPLSAAELEHIARALFDVLAATHGAGIVHRDLKPQNIRLTEDGRVFVLDFGSARLDAASQLTATGTTVGTPDYMAPELFAGSVYDPRADIYGAGATLFHCATGRPPQLADSLAELAFKRTKQDAPPVRSLAPELPEAIAQVIDRCLLRAPEERYASATLAAWALDHPELERRFHARRSSHPPCLHCGHAIAPASTRCARCKSDHPFSYAPGVAHVTVESVSEPARFIEEVAARFPELTEPGHLRGLAERAAALSFSRQRYVSFIAPEDAEKIVTDFAAAGVRCKVEDGGKEWRSAWKPLAGIAVFFLVAPLLQRIFIGRATVDPGVVLLPSLLLAFAFVASRLSAMSIAQRGVHAASLLPKAIWPTHRSGVTLGAFVALPLALLFLVSAVSLAYRGHFNPVRLMVPQLLSIAIVSTVLIASVVYAWAARFSSGPRPAAGSPEPGFWRKLSIGFLGGRAPELAGAGRPRFMATAASVLVILVLIPLELFVIHGIQSSAGKIVSKDRFAASVAAAVSTAESSGPAPAQPVPSRARAIARDDAASVAWVVCGAALTAVLSGALVVLIRRRRRIRNEADRILSELPETLLAALRARTPPQHRRPGRPWTPADHLARQDVRDPFARDALCRAVDLAHCLPEEETAKLVQVIDVMSKRKATRTAEASSLLARCILETDPEQKLRFELLALEGELEATAATAWAEAVREAAA